MKQSGVTPIIERVCRSLGLPLDIEPDFRWVGQITLRGGRRRYFRGANFDLNGLGASEIARDKAYATYYLSRMGYPVPMSGTFYSRRWCRVIGSRKNPDHGWRFAKRLGTPVIVKPNSLSQGAGVFKVHTKREFMSAAAQITRKDRVFLVQELVTGNDYRIVVLDGEVISAYQRTPLAVVGDGKHSISWLLKMKQKRFRQIGRDTVINLGDTRIDRTLARQGLTRRGIMKRGERVELLPNANLSSGGDAVDVTSTVHPAWRRLCAKIAKDMNLRYVGIDVITRRNLEVRPEDYVILEVNAAAGLDNYAAMGKPQRRIVEQLYTKVVHAMIR